MIQMIFEGFTHAQTIQSDIVSPEKFPSPKKQIVIETKHTTTPRKLIRWALDQHKQSGVFFPHPGGLQRSAGCQVTNFCCWSIKPPPPIAVRKAHTTKIPWQLGGILSLSIPNTQKGITNQHTKFGLFQESFTARRFLIWLKASVRVYVVSWPWQHHLWKWHAQKVFWVRALACNACILETLGLLSNAWHVDSQKRHVLLRHVV